MTGHPCAIFDMDGTLVDVAPIRHYVGGSDYSRDFTHFHGASSLMRPIPHVVELAQWLDRAGLPIVVLTSRKAMWRQRSRAWLAKWEVPVYALGMRADHDSRRDDDVKRDLFGKVRSELGLDPVIAFDDNPVVVALWRSLDIPVVRVPGWDDHLRDTPRR